MDASLSPPPPTSVHRPEKSINAPRHLSKSPLIPPEHPRRFRERFPEAMQLLLRLLNLLPLHVPPVPPVANHSLASHEVARRLRTLAGGDEKVERFFPAISFLLQCQEMACLVVVTGSCQARSFATCSDHEDLRAFDSSPQRLCLESGSALAA